MRVITLLYHDVVPDNHPETSGFLSPGANRYKLTETHFRKHLDAIGRVRQDPPRDVFSALAPNNKTLPFLITFDDGGKSAYRPIADMLEERGWIGHFFITTDYIGEPGFVNRSEIRELQRRGHVIGSHSCSHPGRMSACSPSQVRREWRDSTAVLADILGKPIHVASIPAGYYSEDVAQGAAESGITALFSSEPQTRSWKIGDCTILGRFCAQDRTPPERMAAIVQGDRAPRFVDYSSWNCKKILKRSAGDIWLRFRAGLLGPNCL